MPPVRSWPLSPSSGDSRILGKVDTVSRRNCRKTRAWGAWPVSQGNGPAAPSSAAAGEMSARHPKCPPSSPAASIQTSRAPTSGSKRPANQQKSPSPPSCASSSSSPTPCSATDETGNHFCLDQHGYSNAKTLHRTGVERFTQRRSSQVRRCERIRSVWPFPTPMVVDFGCRSLSTVLLQFLLTHAIRFG